MVREALVVTAVVGRSGSRGSSGVVVEDVEVVVVVVGGRSRSRSW